MHAITVDEPGRFENKPMPLMTQGLMRCNPNSNIASAGAPAPKNRRSRTPIRMDPAGNIFR